MFCLEVGDGEKNLLYCGESGRFLREVFCGVYFLSDLGLCKEYFVVKKMEFSGLFWFCLYMVLLVFFFKMEKVSGLLVGIIFRFL